MIPCTPMGVGAGGEIVLVGDSTILPLEALTTLTEEVTMRKAMTGRTEAAEEEG